MAEESLRVAVADNNSTDRHRLTNILEDLGHEVVAEVSNGEQLVNKVAEHKPDLAIADLEMPGMDGLQAVERISRDGGTPVVMTTDHHSPQQVHRALERENVVGYLVKPFASAALDGAMRLAHGLFRRFHGLRERLSVLQRSHSERQIVEEAKDVLMARFKIGEPEAHRRLQKMASSRNQRMVDLARAIVDAGKAQEKA